MSKKTRRIHKRIEAANFLEKNADPVMRMLADVVGDLAEENEGLSQFAQDMNLAMELGHRLDGLVHSSDPIVEALDGPIGALIAGIAIAIWRGVARQDKIRKARIGRIEERLRKRGPQMAVLMRKRLERRLKRIKRRAAAASS